MEVFKWSNKINIFIGVHLDILSPMWVFYQIKLHWQSTFDTTVMQNVFKTKKNVKQEIIKTHRKPQALLTPHN